MSARKNRPDQDGSVVLPSKAEVPRDEKKRSSFISEWSAKVMRAANPVGDHLKVIVGQNSQMVRKDEALEKAREMLCDHYGVDSPEPVSQPRAVPIGYGLQYA